MGFYLSSFSLIFIAIIVRLALSLSSAVELMMSMELMWAVVIFAVGFLLTACKAYQILFVSFLVFCLSTLEFIILLIATLAVAKNFF